MSGGVGHRVHSMGEALVAPDWAPLGLEEAAEVVAGVLVDVREVTLLWHSPRPFSAAALVGATHAGGSGRFLLKRHHRALRPPAMLALEHAFIAHLRERALAVPAVRARVDARPGEPATVHQRGDFVYEVHDHAPGCDLYRDAPSWSPFSSRAQARHAGTALAALHEASAGFDHPARRAVPLLGADRLILAADLYGAIEEEVALFPALGTFLAGRPWRSDLAGALVPLQRRARSAVLGREPLWAHNDWHPSNLFWECGGHPDAGVRAIIDFSLANRTSALFDLATAIERTAVNWLAPPEHWRADRASARALLAGYCARLPLGRDERGALAALLPVVHLDYALSEIAYFAGIVGSPANAALAYEGFLLAHAAFFETPAGAALLAAVAAE